MTQTSVNVSQVRDNLSEILSRVKIGQETVTIEKKGKPYAVIMSSDHYAKLQKIAREQFGAVVRRIQSRNANLDPDEVMRDVTAEVEAVRRELYEKGE
jgi:prevent-host-death family protein